jgi:hypothetical protein
MRHCGCSPVHGGSLGLVFDDSEGERDDSYAGVVSERLWTEPTCRKAQR